MALSDVDPLDSQSILSFFRDQGSQVKVQVYHAQTKHLTTLLAGAAGAGCDKAGGCRRSGQPD